MPTLQRMARTAWSATRCASQQTSKGLDYGRKWLMLGEPGKTSRHRFGGDEPTREEREQSEEHRRVARRLDALG